MDLVQNTPTKNRSRIDTPVQIRKVTLLGQTEVKESPRAILDQFLSNKAGYDQMQLVVVFGHILQDLVERVEKLENGPKIVLN